MLLVIGKEFGLYSGDEAFRERSDKLAIRMREKSLWQLGAEWMEEVRLWR